jgi:hypothetical protein
VHEIESLILLLAALLAQLIRLLTVLYPTLLVLRGFVPGCPASRFPGRGRTRMHPAGVRSLRAHGNR